MTNKITVQELLDKDFRMITGTGFEGDVKFSEINADDFLEFAKEDSKGMDLRSYVNVLSNVKRAIECRIDTILYVYCLHEKSEKEEWDFPKKIEIIKQLGIVAPSILKRINKKRNELEHQYVKPTKEEVDDGLDVAELFLAYTRRLVTEPFTSFSKRDDYEIELDRKKGTVTLIDKKKMIGEQLASMDSNDGWLEFAQRLAMYVWPLPFKIEF
jgi:hypothetical protein